MMSCMVLMVYPVLFAGITKKPMTIYMYMKLTLTWVLASEYQKGFLSVLQSSVYIIGWDSQPITQTWEIH